ncbi:MAG: SDR family oxidoreductase [Verrucomicrobia bacterium]|nr:MAG: SDR family oxidoreductase [Verrucomicrobiota bacterium]
MSAYERVKAALRAEPKTWLVTGAAGFIGSHLVEHLLALDQRVIGLDDFSTGHQRSLDEVKALVTPAQWARFQFRRGDICDEQCCREACREVELVLHQAAMGSVPRSIAEPLAAHRINVTGFVNMLTAAKDAGVRRFVFASSSAVYGDNPDLPKTEERIGNALSPYAATKLANEIYAAAFSRCYGLECVGLRYFNVFGPRQDPEGAYAAVIPKWISALLHGAPVQINGDGSTSRDFCYVENVVQANLLAATTRDSAALNQVFNIAVGERTTLKELLGELQASLRAVIPELPASPVHHADFRPGDILHSLADISKARRRLAFAPTHSVAQGLARSMDWYRRNLS